MATREFGADHPPVRESPEAQNSRQRHFTCLSKDRYGWIGMTDFWIDERSASFHVDYRSEEHAKGGQSAPVFLDDHYRNINGNFFRADYGKRGGRDDRDFKLERSETLKTELRELEQISARQQKDFLQRGYELGGKFMPGKIEPALEITSSDFEYESEDSRSTRISTTNSYYIAWYILDSVRFSDKKRLAKREYLGIRADEHDTGARQEAQERFSEIAAQAVPEDVLQKLEDLKKDYLDKRTALGFPELEDEMAKTRREIDQFYAKEDLEVTINLYEKGTPEHDYLLKILGDRPSLMLEGQTLKIGDPEAARIYQEQCRREQAAEALRRVEQERLLAEQQQAARQAREERAAVEARQAAEHQAREVKEKAERQAAREAELTPEIRQKIENSMDELDAFFAIIHATPSNHQEVKKILSFVPRFCDLRVGYQNGSSGKEILEEMSKTLAYTDGLLERKKVNEAFPKFKERVYATLDKWRSVVGLVDESNDAAMVIEDGLSTREAFIAQVRREFLKDPWKSKIQELINPITTQMIENLET